jgi:hypothetical protein
MLAAGVGLYKYPKVAMSCRIQPASDFWASILDRHELKEQVCSFEHVPSPAPVRLVRSWNINNGQA